MESPKILLVALLLAVLSFVSAQNTTINTNAPTPSPFTTSPFTTIPPTTIPPTTSPPTTSAPTPPPSFCEICRDKGQCQQAYRGNPGIFCGSWLSPTSQRLACCCPADAVCKKSDSNYKCECGKRKSESKKSAASSLGGPQSMSSAVAAASLLAAGVAALI